MSLVVGVAILLTGFAAGVTVPRKTAARTAPSVPPASTTSTLLEILEPNVEQRAAYLGVLRELNRQFASNPDRAVRLGQNLCLDIAEDMPKPMVEDNVLKQFSGAVNVGLDQAPAIVAAANRYICPKITMNS
ncbi:DUF732 domain-containing protein [Sphaerisporangium sp. NPDC049003]|uniref:DUF732 domain-containing protein n=1 Tax=Sphaerisporangium sp. NPDC049003 TaxID=3364517 RepID=UPI00371F7B59